MIEFKERILTTGQYAEVEVFPVVYHSRCRRKKYKPTTEAQQHINEAHSVRKLARLIHTNFTEADYALHPTYNDYYAPETYKECENDVKNFILRLRRKYRKADIELKYIYAIEYDSRWHAHLIINGGVDRTEIEECWGKGYANAINLEFTENGVKDLAGYIQKQHIAYKRWVGSRNLKKPPEQKRAISKKAVADLCESWNIQSFIDNRYPGYFLVLDESEKICNPTNGLEYVRLFLCRKDAKLFFMKNDKYSKYAISKTRYGKYAINKKAKKREVANDYEYIEERFF